MKTVLSVFICAVGGRVVCPPLLLVQHKQAAQYILFSKDGHSFGSSLATQKRSRRCHRRCTLCHFAQQQTPPQNINIPPVASSSTNIDDKLFGEGSQPLDCQCNEECANQIGKVELGVQASFSFFIISLTDLATLMKSREFDSKISNSAMGFARYRMFSSVIKGNFNFESV